MPKPSIIRRSLSCLAGLALIPAAFQAHAQAYPSRPITIVLPFAAGSGTDTVTRLIATELSKGLGQPVIVDNKPGANGTLAAAAVARAAPDGYTLLVTPNTTITSAPFLVKNLPYDPVKDFSPIALTGYIPFILVTGQNVPAKNVQELTSYARANPDKLSYASGSSLSIVLGETYAKRAGMKLLHVPYKSSPPALTDVTSGVVSMMFVDITAAMPLVNAGRLRALAVTTKERSVLAPNLPSMQEAGVPDFDITSWQGYFGPARMPAEVVTRLNTELRKVIENPKMRATLRERGMDAFCSTPEELRNFVDDQLPKWGRLFKDAGIQPE